MAKPVSDVEIEYVPTAQAARAVAVHEGRVVAMDLLAPDVMRVRLEVEGGERIPFYAGQYINILLEDGQNRAFSFATAPHEPGPVELHIRRVEGGRFGLPGNIDGLVHLSDLSWNNPGEEAVINYKKGDEIEAVILSIDVERERISLGIKQMEGDPFTNFVAEHDKNSIIDGTVKSIDAKGAVIALTNEVEGYLRASEVSRDRVEYIRTHLKEGDKVETMIINVDRKNRTINLSIKAKDKSDESSAMQKIIAPVNAGTTSLGALLKAKMDSKNPEE